MATCSSILAKIIPWIEEPGGLQSTESQRVGRRVTEHLHVVCDTQLHLCICVCGVYLYQCYADAS